MASNTNLPENETLWTKLFSGQWLLGVGAFLILINVAVFFGIDTRPSAWLCYLDMRYWSGYFSVALWVIALWLISESTDIVEDYLPVVRMVTVICMLLAIVFGLQSSFGAPSLGNSLWFYAVAIVATFCIVRSLFLLYNYRYGDEESIDMEEAQWFWGVSGFLFVCLTLLGLMCMIQVKEPPHPGMGDPASVSLFTSCRDGLHALIQNGQGSFALKVFSLLVFIATAAFVYVAGKWFLIFLSKMREN